MTNFTDSKNRTWNIDWNFGTLRRVKSELGYDLENIMTMEAEDGTPLSAQLATDSQLFVDVVFCLVKTQAQDANVDQANFDESIDGKAFAEMNKAFWESARFFSRAKAKITSRRQSKSSSKPFEPNRIESSRCWTR